jgi:hypothetical protein
MQDDQEEYEMYEYTVHVGFTVGFRDFLVGP